MGGEKSERKDPEKEGSRKKSYATYIVITAVLVLILYTLLQEPEDPLKMIYRAAGTLGYFAIFLAVVSSEYMAQMKKVFGTSFIKAHHTLARAGILLILIHPLAFAFEKQNIGVFLPVFYPPETFLELAGRPAFYLFLLGTGAAVYRKKYRNWKKAHYFNYLAFLMVSVHALLIGTDFETGIMRMFALAMTIIVTGIFIHKRFGKKIKKAAGTGKKLAAPAKK